MLIQPYLFFDGRCDEAIEFYKKAIGAEVEMLMRWKDAPDKSMCTPANENKVMHSCLKIGDTNVMASDGRNTGNPKFDGFALSLDVKTDAEAATLFKALSDGGEVRDADGPDLLRLELRHGARPFRRALDGAQGEVSATQQNRESVMAESKRVRHVARVRRAARAAVAMLHRSGTHEALVGPEGLHRARPPRWICASAAPTTTA